MGHTCNPSCLGVQGQFSGLIDDLIDKELLLSPLLLQKAALIKIYKSIVHFMFSYLNGFSNLLFHVRFVLLLFFLLLNVI